MEMSRHTPGPWEAYPSMDRREMRVTAPHPDSPSNRLLIASLDRGRETSIDEAEANARLIAAAPDLRYALQAFVDYFEQAGIGSDLKPEDEENGVRGFDGDTVFNVRQAKAAIAKARGTSA